MHWNLASLSQISHIGCGLNVWVTLFSKWSLLVNEGTDLDQVWRWQYTRVLLEMWAVKPYSDNSSCAAQSIGRLSYDFLSAPINLLAGKFMIGGSVLLLIRSQLPDCLCQVKVDPIYSSVLVPQDSLLGFINLNCVMASLQMLSILYIEETSQHLQACTPVSVCHYYSALITNCKDFL